jgi:dUTPase
VGVDLRAPFDIHLPHGTEMFVNTGIVVDPRGAPGVHAEIRMRSSAAKIQLAMANTLGTIDPDYCLGPKDTLGVWLRRPELFPVISPGSAPLPPATWSALVKERLNALQNRFAPWDPLFRDARVFRLEDPVAGKAGRALLFKPVPGSGFSPPGIPVLLVEEGGEAAPDQGELLAYEVSIPAVEAPGTPLFRRGERFAQVVFIRHASAEVEVRAIPAAEFFGGGEQGSARGGFGGSGVA